jgi:hypothetical protein
MDDQLLLYDLGFFDDQSGRVESVPNPFGAKVLPMCPEWTLFSMLWMTGFEPATPTSRSCPNQAGRVLSEVTPGLRQTMDRSTDFCPVE